MKRSKQEGDYEKNKVRKNKHNTVKKKRLEGRNKKETTESCKRRRRKAKRGRMKLKT